MQYFWCLMAHLTSSVQLQDAGGFQALVDGTVTDMQRMDVMEMLTVLERLNPTPRPTT